MNPSRQIAPELLALPVAGTNLVAGSFADQLGERPTLLYFLRHFGCMFCRESVRELRRLVEAEPDYPDILFVHQGVAADGAAFFAEYWPAARAVADPDLRLYTTFGIHRSDIRRVVQPDLWRRAVRNILAANPGGRPRGDISLQPGLFVVQGGEILWEHPYRHAGDHPDWAALPDVVRQAQVAA
jgi:hypothetical protein